MQIVIYKNKKTMTFNFKREQFDEIRKMCYTLNIKYYCINYQRRRRMSDFLKDIIKETGNEYASLVADGMTAGDIDGFIDTGSYTLNALLSGSISIITISNKITTIAGEQQVKHFALGIVKHF